MSCARLTVSVLFAPESGSTLVWLFYSSSFWPCQSYPSDDAAQLLLSCSFPDYLVWYFMPPCDMQYPPQPSVMRRLQSPVIGHVLAPYSSVLSTMDSYSRTLVSTLQPLLFHILWVQTFKLQLRTVLGQNSSGQNVTDKN